MKKISVFIYSFGAGGAERVVSNLLENLSKRYEIYLILMNETIFYEIPKGVKVHLLENSAPFENGIKKFLKLPFLALKYKKLSKNLGIKTHFVWMIRPSFVALIARVLGLRGEFIINECSTPSILYKDGSFKSRVSKFLIKSLYPKADLILPNSKESFRDLAENFGIPKEKMRVLYNAVDLRSIEILSKEPIDFDAPFFLSVGRLDENKNHALLIKSYAKLKNNSVHLIIIGDGLLKDELKNLAKSLNLEHMVHFLGFEKNPFKYMSKCLAFVFTSRIEGFSNVLIEALACSSYVITSDHKSGARELLGDNEWGTLIPVDDESATIKALEVAIYNEKLVKSYKDRAKRRAEIFDKEIVFKEVAKILDESFI